MSRIFFDKVRYRLFLIWLRIRKKFPFLNELPIFYISGSEALPPPLSSEEEANLINRLAIGDKSVKSILIERNPACFILPEVWEYGIGLEELISIGTIEL